MAVEAGTLEKGEGGRGLGAMIARLFRQLLAFVGIHQMALSLFRFVAVLGRTLVIASTF
ncbi:Pleiotropic drug resistance protein 2, partial [Sarracenia purpurea var. burkii]